MDLPWRGTPARSLPTGTSTTVVDGHGFRNSPLQPEIVIFMVVGGLSVVAAARPDHSGARCRRGVGDTVSMEYVSRVPLPPLDGLIDDFTTWRVCRRTPG